jgi:hypothetical protein
MSRHPGEFVRLAAKEGMIGLSQVDLKVEHQGIGCEMQATSYGQGKAGRFVGSQLTGAARWKDTIDCPVAIARAPS